MIPFFQELALPVSSHDHLVEIKCNAESPAEVRYKKEMHENCDSITCTSIRRNWFFVSGNECTKADANTDAEKTNQFDRISPNFVEYEESDESAQGSCN